VTAEIGKPHGEALAEIREIVDTCDFFLGEGRRLYGQTVPSEMPTSSSFTFRKPVGAVAVITAGNFPVAVPAWYIVPALLAGNSIVWKPAEYSAVARPPSTRSSSGAAGCPTACSTSCTPTDRPRFAGLERSLDAGLIDKVGFTGSSPSAGDRRAHRAASADRLPGARAARIRWSSRPAPTSIWPWKAPCSPASAPVVSAAPRSAR
jgi:aldehyde dehydrogenase (NAD+)